MSLYEKQSGSFSKPSRTLRHSDNILHTLYWSSVQLAECSPNAFNLCSYGILLKPWTSFVALLWIFQCILYPFLGMDSIFAHNIPDEVKHKYYWYID